MTGRARRFILAYVMMKITKKKIDWAELGRVYRADTNTNDAVRRVKYVFHQEAFQRMIQIKMIEVFKERNKTEGNVIAMLDEAFDMAKANKDPKEMRLATEKFIELFDMLPEKKLGRIPGYPVGEEADFEDIDKTISDAQLATTDPPELTD